MSRYGEVHQRFFCRGELRGTNFNVPCEIEILHLHRGAVICVCKAEQPIRQFATVVERLTGALQNGTEFDADLYGSQIELLVDPGDDVPEAAAFGARNVSFGAWPEVGIARFHVTNATEFEEPISLRFPYGTAVLSKNVDFDTRSRELRANHGVLVTSTLEVTARTQDEAERVADEFCDLMSVAQGSRVQWISCHFFENDEIVGGEHGNRVTKNYTHARLVESRDLQFFLEQCAAHLGTTNRWPVRHLLGSWLDSKTSNDFLELRAIKAVVCLEGIKDSFLDLDGTTGYIFPENEFDSFQPKIRAALSLVLTELGWSNAQRAAAYRGIKSLNRESFGSILTRLVAYLEGTLSESEIAWFVRCRNRLVHSGDFLTANGAEDLDGAPFSDRVGEYFWLSHVVDRVVLRIFGYSGRYLDRRDPRQRVTSANP